MKKIKIVFTLALIAVLCMPAMAQKSTKKAKKELMSTVSQMDEKQQLMVLKYARSMEKVNAKKALAKTFKKLSPEDRQKLMTYATQLSSQKTKAKVTPPKAPKAKMKDKVAKKTKPAKSAKPTIATPTGLMTKVEVIETSHDFGVITQGEKAQHIYKIKNVGSNPLVITRAKGSCGCTIPKWPKDPVAPGEIAEIDVVFNSRGKKGKQNKRITITANTEPVSTILTIKGEVKMPTTNAKPKPASPVKE